MRLKAETPVYGGFVIGRAEGVVFIKGALPGETVEVEITEKKKDYSIALVNEVLEPSPSRVEPPCSSFGICGGCQLQHISYAEQVLMKNSVLKDALKRLGGIEPDLLEPVYGERFGYRHRGQFKISPEGEVGFFKEASRTVVPVRRCLNLTGRINEMLAKIRSFDSLKGLKEIHLTEGWDEILALVKGRDFDEALAEEFIGAGLSGIAFEDGSYRGKGHLVLDLNGQSYSVSPWSFFQSNWALNREMVEIIKGTLSPLEGSEVLDIYAGGGNFSIPLAADVSRIVAVEENAYAVKDGMRNLELNRIRNMRFIQAPVEKYLLQKARSFNIVIIDPPRPGLSRDAVSRLLELAPEIILYISCNPSTLARDLRKLSSKYKIDWVRMVDLFPNTFHIESLSLLTRNK